MVQGVSFKCKAKMARHHDEKSFINKEPKIEMKNRIESIETSKEFQVIVISNYKLETEEKINYFSKIHP